MPSNNKPSNNKPSNVKPESIYGAAYWRLAADDLGNALFSGISAIYSIAWGGCNKSLAHDESPAPLGFAARPWFLRLQPPFPGPGCAPGWQLAAQWCAGAGPCRYGAPGCDQA